MSARGPFNQPHTTIGDIVVGERHRKDLPRGRGANAVETLQ